MQPGGKGESNCQLTDCTGGCCIWRTKAQLAHCYAALPSYLREPLNCAARSSLPVESFRAKCLLRRAAKHTRSRCSPFFRVLLLLTSCASFVSYSFIVDYYMYIYFIYIYILFERSSSSSLRSFSLSRCRAFVPRSPADRSVTGYRLSWVTSWVILVCAAFRTACV